MAKRLFPHLDAAFQKLLRTLTPDEESGLRAKLLNEGLRERFVVWKEQNILLDGYSRMRICEEEGIQISKKHFRYISLPDRNAALDWMVENQQSRRNLDPKLVRYFRGKEWIEKKQAQGGAKPQSAAPGRTSDAIGKKHGVSGDTIERDGQFAADVDDIADEEGESSIDVALRSTKRFRCFDCPKTFAHIHWHCCCGEHNPIDYGKCRYCGESCPFSYNDLKQGAMADAAEEWVAQRKQRPKENVDADGVSIPAILKAVFESTGAALRTAFQRLTSVRSEVSRLADRQAPGTELMRPEMIARLRDLIDVTKQLLHAATPYRVCSVCHGKRCKKCEDRGWMPADQDTWSIGRHGYARMPQVDPLDGGAFVPAGNASS